MWVYGRVGIVLINAEWDLLYSPVSSVNRSVIVQEECIISVSLLIHIQTLTLIHLKLS